MILRSALTLAAPGVPALLPAALWMGWAPPPALAQGAGGYAYAVLAAVALLAWRFRRSRAAGACAALALLAALLPLAGSDGAHLATALLAPTLALLALPADRGLATPPGLLHLALPGMAAAGGAALVAEHPATLARALGHAPLAELPPLPGGLPLPAALTAAAGVAALAALALRRGRAIEAGLFWCALAGTLAAGSAPPVRGAWLLAGALGLGVALVEAAYALAFRDELTGLPGRRALSALLGTLRAPYAVAVVDVDHFKRFNDRHGHDVGDQVLRMVAARLDAVGGGGRAFRSGGEEFTLVFPGLDAAAALPHLETVRRAVAEAPFAVRRPFRTGSARGKAGRGRGPAGGRTLRVTVSVGVATGGGRGGSLAAVKSADRAMYRAKRGGRNRVVA